MSVENLRPRDEVIFHEVAETMSTRSLVEIVDINRCRSDLAALRLLGFLGLRDVGDRPHQGTRLTTRLIVQATATKPLHGFQHLCGRGAGALDAAAVDSAFGRTRGSLNTAMRTASSTRFSSLMPSPHLPIGFLEQEPVEVLPA